jgi:hypothetical protein
MNRVRGNVGVALSAFGKNDPKKPKDKGSYFTKAQLMELAEHVLTAAKEAGESENPKHPERRRKGHRTPEGVTP